MFCFVGENGGGVFGDVATGTLTTVSVPGGVANTAEFTGTAGERALLVRFARGGGWRYSAVSAMTPAICALFAHDPDSESTPRDERAWMRTLFREVASSGVPNARAFVVA
jgi:hypothetical protein